jgi:hypothetical protein
MAHNLGQVALQCDLCEIESYSRGARPALWDVAGACEYMDSSAPSRVESGLSSSRAASSLYGRRLSREARDATDGRALYNPPLLA